MSAAGFSGGDGSSSTPYLISDETDLRQLATDVNGGTNYASNYFELTQNIALNGEWTPIGNSNSNYFRGTFDGAGYTVNGFSITQVNSVAGEHHYGLFGYLGGTVKNLNVAGSITLTGEQYTSNIGGLAGYLDYGTIQNCTSDVSISASSSAVIYAGGLVGNAYGQISESSASGDVTTTTTYPGSDSADNYEFTSSSGGLVGFIKGGKIENCSASGTVRAENNAETATNNAVLSAGGIVGYNSVALTNCFSTSQVNADFGNGRAYAGGITGWQLGATSNCFTTGSVTANTTSKSSYSGGIAGMNYASIDKCYATGKVTANPTTGNSHAGGIVGHGESAISNSYALNSGISGGYKNGTAGSIYGASLTANYVLNGLFTPSDGTSVASSSVWNQVFGLFTDANGWKINEGNNNFKLPVLKNLPAPANADASHLSVPCITFYANGGTEGTMQPQFVEGNSVTLNANKFKKEGYSFTGWATTENGGVAYADNETIQDVNADITLFAQWKINQYTLKFEDYYNQQTVYCETKLDYGATVPTTFEGLPPTKTGYTFYGWHIAIPSTMPANNVTIMALWNITQYNVTFNTMDGSEIPILKVNYSETIGERAPANPTKHGYNFEGWYNESDCTNKWIMIGNGAGVVTDNITLYANWTAWKHFITFHNYAGVEQVKELTYGSDMNLPKNTFFTNEDENKHFGGWAITEGGAVFYEDEADVSSLFTANNGETDLYAVWLDTPITYRNVTFMIDGTEEYLMKLIQHGKALHVADKPTEPTRPGYDFLGWYKESTLDTALSFDNDYVVDAD
ncbi:InlB B-repeat-containing protein, partial [Methanocorpusculum sp.]|nr:InlB B-repeat-containing protein [Methanocorpusculum sp.]